MSLVHEIRPDATTIAEDVSGMPGLGAPAGRGRRGFRLPPRDGRSGLLVQAGERHARRRLGDRDTSGTSSPTAAPRKRLSVTSKVTTRRWSAASRSFSNSRMPPCTTRCGSTRTSLAVERALAIHKMARLATLATAGHGYMNFIGNEFGHPEWVDFPREGNGWSFHSRPPPVEPAR